MLNRGLLKGVGLLILLLATSLPPTSSAAVPGDKPSTALQLSLGRASYTLLSGTHFFKVYMEKEQTLSVELQVPYGSNYDLHLYDPESRDGDLIELASSQHEEKGVDESLTYLAEKFGYYYLAVKGIRYTGPATYDLAVFITHFTITSARWGSPTSTLDVGAGDQGVPLTLTVRHEMPYSLSSLTGTLTLNPYLTNSSGGERVKAYHNLPVSSGGTATFTYTLNIDEDAPIGLHNLTLTLAYQMISGTDLIRGIPVALNFSIPLHGRINFQVSTPTSHLLPGRTSPVTLHYTNLGGGRASAVEITLTAPPTVTLVNANNHWFFTAIEGGQSVEVGVSIYVPNTITESAFQLTTTIIYQNPYGSVVTVTRTIGFTVSLEEVSLIVVDTTWGPTTSPREVGPGDVGVPLYVVVENTGRTPVTGLQATLHLPYPFTNYTGGDLSRSYYGGTLLPGQTATLKFTLSASRAGGIGVYTGTLTLNYLVVRGALYQPGGPTLLPVKILLLGKVDLTLSSTPSQLLPGEVNRIVISAMNLGTGTASSLDITVTLPPTVSLIEGDNHKHFTALPPKGVVHLPLSLYIPSTAAWSALQLTASVSYTDAYGNVKVVNRNLGFTVPGEVGSLEVLQTSWGSPVQGEVGPGDKAVPFYVTVQNTGKGIVTGVNATLLLPPPFTNITGGVKALSYIQGQIPPGQTALLQFTLNVKEDAALGEYPSNLTVTYLVAKGGLYERVEPRIFQVSLYLLGKVNLEVALEASPLIPGAVGNVTLLLSNLGTATASSIDLSLSLPITLTLKGMDNHLHVSSLDPLRSVRWPLAIYITPKVGDTVLPITLTLTYRDGYGALHTQTRSLGVRVRAWTSPISVSMEGGILKVGKTSEVHITILNIASNPIYSLQVKLTLPSAAGTSPLILIQGSNEWYFPHLPVEGRVSLSPKIFASLNAIDNSYQAQLTLTYKDPFGAQYTEVRSLGFTTRGEVIFDVYNVEAPSTSQGGMVTVTGEIINKGSTSAMYTRLSIKPSQAFRPLPGTQVYLGEIAPNTPLPFTAQAMAAPNIPNGTYPLTLLFTYEDDYHQVYTYEATVRVRVGGIRAPPTPRAQPTAITILDQVINYLPYLLVIFIVVSAGAWSMVKRRRRLARLRRRIGLEEGGGSSEAP